MQFDRKSPIYRTRVPRAQFINTETYPSWQELPLIGTNFRWLVVCFGFSRPLRQYFSRYRAVFQRERERGERKEESKNVQTTPTRTYCMSDRPFPYYFPNCRTPRHWKFTQDHRNTHHPTIFIVPSLFKPLKFYFTYLTITKLASKNQPAVSGTQPNKMQPTFVISKLKGPSETLRDIRTSTY